MREIKVASAALGLTIGVLAAVPAGAWDRKDASINILATLPALVDINNALTAFKSSAEGITVGLDGNIYVVSSGVDNGVTPIPPDSPANLFVIRPNGTFLRGGVPCVPGPATPCSLHIGNSSAFALGLRFNPVTGLLWLLDSGVPKMLGLDPITGATSVFPIPFQDNAALNALTFDGDGNGYVSDSVNGRIYRVTRGGEAATIWSSDPQLLPAPGENLSPPVGVNGIEFNPPNCRPAVLPCELFAANTANRQILRIIADANGNALPATVFVNGINGPDGVAIDSTTNPANIWVTANQSDEIVVIQSGGATPGRVIAKLGDFDGLEDFGPGPPAPPQRRVVGFLFPASLAFSNLPVPPGGQRMLYVTNLASPNMRAIDSPWATLVTDYTVSQLPVPIIPATGCFTGPGNC